LQFQAGSRQWLYDAIANWLESSSAGDHQQTSRVFWIQADPGMGKSSFAATLRKKLKDEQRLLGSFFYRDTEKNDSPAKVYHLNVLSLFLDLLPGIKYFRTISWS
jgi:hypothetical protein